MLQPDKLDLKVILKEEFNLSTNDLFIRLKVPSITGYQNLFRLNVNLYLPKLKFENSISVENENNIRMNKSTKSINVSPRNSNLSGNKLKKSKSRHILNDIGQIIGIEKNDKPNQSNSEKNIFVDNAENDNLDSSDIDNSKNQNESYRINFNKIELDKPDSYIPFDFELELNFKNIELDKEWMSKWEELEKLRKYIKSRLRKDSKLGDFMLNGIKSKN